MAGAAIFLATCWYLKRIFTRFFFSPKRNAIDLSANKQLTKIKAYAADRVEIGGFLIHPSDRAKTSERVIVYMHGVTFPPEEKIPSLCKQANDLNCQIVIFNYRGYAYSANTQPTNAGIKLDVQAMLNWVIENDMVLGADKFLWGRSFGVATALHMMSLSSE